MIAVFKNNGKNYNVKGTTQYPTQSHQARFLLGKEHQYMIPEQAQEYHQYELLIRLLQFS